MTQTASPTQVPRTAAPPAVSPAVAATALIAAGDRRDRLRGEDRLPIDRHGPRRQHLGADHPRGDRGRGGDRVDRPRRAWPRLWTNHVPAVRGCRGAHGGLDPLVGGPRRVVGRGRHEPPPIWRRSEPRWWRRGWCRGGGRYCHSDRARQRRHQRLGTARQGAHLEPLRRVVRPAAGAVHVLERDRPRRRARPAGDDLARVTPRAHARRAGVGGPRARSDDLGRRAVVLAQRGRRRRRRGRGAAGVRPHSPAKRGDAGAWRRRRRRRLWLGAARPQPDRRWGPAGGAGVRRARARDRAVGRADRRRASLGHGSAREWIEPGFPKTVALANRQGSVVPGRAGSRCSS